jgi:hypothetical protein
MNYIAVVGPTNNVKVIDRRGKVKKEIPINSNKEIQSMEWDMDSDTISIVIVVWTLFRPILAQSFSGQYSQSKTLLRSTWEMESRFPFKNGLLLTQFLLSVQRKEA